ncbi:MAG TPA: DUF4328 domain-containing protein [Gaiellaceae bacterium]|nr:DUF4328 domain-containing protein [Gaiellaceae bacterium]
MSQADHPLADLYARPDSPGRFVLGPGYQSPAGRSRKARWFIGLSVALNMLSILLLGLQRALLEQGPISASALRTSVDRVNGAADIELVLFVVALVLFLRWVHLSYRNLIALGTRDLRFTPGWAVGYWFVPVLNIWRPAEVLGDLWRATDPRADDNSWRSLRSTPLIGWWWAIGLVAGPVAWAAQAMPADTISELHSKNAVLILVHVLEVAAGACLFAVVGKLTARQDARAALRAREA